MNCNDHQFFGLNSSQRLAVTRRTFLANSAAGLGLGALGSLLGGTAKAAPTPATSTFPNFAPKAKRVIYLFQSGAPSQMDLFDPKPEMVPMMPVPPRPSPRRLTAAV